MNKQMIVAGLKARPVRTTVSILAVALEVTLILVVIGLTSGISQETGKRTEGVGADIMFQPPNSSMFLALNNSTLPMAYAGKIHEIEGVKAVAGVQTQVNSSAGLEIVYGIDPQAFDAVSGGFIWHKGGIFKSADDIVVDDIYARAKNVRVGDQVEVLNHKFKVAGIVEHGKGARLFVPIQTLQELSGARDKASVFFLKCTRREHTAAVTEQIRKLFPRHEIRPLKDFLSLMTSTNLPGLETFIHSMIALAVAIGFLVIFLSMYTTILERTREIGVLKSLGASKGYVAKAILSESTLLCLVGIVVGVGMSYAVRKIFLTAFPTLSILITADWILRAAAIAMGGGLLGASYPAWVASRKDPVEALTYE